MAKSFSVFVEINGKLGASLGQAVSAAEGQLKRLSNVYKANALAAKSQLAEIADSYKGIAKMAAAGGIVFSVKHAFEGGAELAHELSNLKNAGRTAQEVADGLKAANQTIRDMPTASLTNSVKLLNETTGAYGDFKHAVENLGFNSKLGDILKNSLKVEDPAHELGSLVKTLEIRGAAGNAERYKEEAARLGQAMVFYGGRLKSDDLYTFASNAATGIKQLDDRFLTRIAPALIQEQGGDKVGTGLTAFRTIISGRKITDQVQAKAWQALGLLDSKSVVKNPKTGSISWKDGAIQGTDLAYRDPFEFMEKVILPRLQKQGVDINDQVKLGQALNTLFKNTKANAFVTMLSTQMDRLRLHKDEDLMNKVPDLGQIYNDSLLNDPLMAQEAIKSAMSNIGSALTLPLMKPFAQMMISIASAVNKLSAALIEHPEIAALIAKIGAGLLTWQAIRFANLVFGIGAMARVIGNLSLALPLDLASRILATSTAIASISIARLRALVAGTTMLYAVGGRAAVLSALGASLAGLGKAVVLFPVTALRAIGLSMWALVANPVGLALTAIVGGLTALGVWVYNNWGGIVSFFGAFGESFMKALGPRTAGLISAVAGWLGSVWNWLSRILGPLDETGEKWKAWGEWAGKGAAAVVNAITGLPGMLAGLAKKAFDALLSFNWASAGAAIASAIASGLGGLASAPLNWLKGKLGVGGAAPKLGTAMPLAGARALGGPVTKGLPYLVGERGPEIFVPEKTGTIETNGVLKNLANGGRGGGALAIGIDSSSVDEAARRAKRAGELLRTGLDTAVMPIVFTGSIDEATRRADKLRALLALIKNGSIVANRYGSGEGGTPSVDGGVGAGVGGSSGAAGGGSSGGGNGVGASPAMALSALGKAGITDRPVESGLDAFNLYGAKKRGDGIRPIDPNAFSSDMASKAGGDLSPIVGGPGFNVRGVKNMNPGNIGWGRWAREHGATGGAGSDTGHLVAVFPSFEAGYKAMGDLAFSKYRSGAKTLDQLIAGQKGWTPGNHAAAANIARAMGLGPNDDARLDDPAMMAKFKRGLSAQELGPNGAKYALAKAGQEGSAGSFRMAGAFGLGGFNLPKLGDGATPGTAGGGASPNRSKIMELAASNLGLREATEPARLQKYMASGGKRYGVDPRFTPWCAAYVGSTLEQAGIKASGSLLARSYKNWGAGVKSSDAQAGDVMMEGKDLHHVGFATGQKRMKNGQLQVEMLSGNYSNMVRKSWMPASNMTVRRATDKEMEGGAIKLAGARAMGGPVGAGLSYLVGERGPEIFTPGASGGISTNDTLSRLADVGRAVTEGTGQPIAPDPLRVAQASRPEREAQSVDRSFHAGNHVHHWNITGGGDARQIRSQVEGCFQDLIRQMESAQSGSLSD